jgi:hypothetical protein
LQDPPTFTQIGIFGLKTNHLATQLRMLHFGAKFSESFCHTTVQTIQKFFDKKYFTNLKKRNLDSFVQWYREGAKPTNFIIYFTADTESLD